MSHKTIIPKSLKIICLALTALVLFGGSNVWAQQNPNVQIEELRNRIAAQEEYTQKMQAALNEFSKSLVANVDQQLQMSRSKAISLNPTSRKVTRIDTNIGMFLISVQRLDKIDKGYRLYLQIGNPNSATYGDVKMRVYWGTKLDETVVGPAYTKWHQSLSGAEYVYPGSLEAGAWTDIAIDLKPAEFNQVQYIECEMEVNTVRLQKLRAETDVLPR